MDGLTELENEVLRTLRGSGHKATWNGSEISIGSNHIWSPLAIFGSTKVHVYDHNLVYHGDGAFTLGKESSLAGIAVVARNPKYESPAMKIREVLQAYVCEKFPDERERPPVIIASSEEDFQRVLGGYRGFHLMCSPTIADRAASKTLARVHPSFLSRYLRTLPDGNINVDAQKLFKGAY